MKSIILVRHAEPDDKTLARASHWTDTSLTDLGRRQAACVAGRLKADLAGMPCDLWSSDLKRASETADAIGRAIGALPSLTPELREYNDGSAIGGTEEDLRRLPPGATAEPESWRHFYDRVAGCMERLTRDQERLLVVVSHYGAMINIVTWWLGIGLNEADDAKVSFNALLAAVTVLKVNRQGKHAVDRLNDVSHLMAAGLGGELQLAP